MAGNTKLIGFSPDNVVTLERWGKRACVHLPAQAVDDLRGACRRLPSSPGVPESKDIHVQYSERTGQVLVEMSPYEARQLSMLLAHFRDMAELPNWSSVLENLVTSFPQQLTGAARDHDLYVNTNDEPGID